MKMVDPEFLNDCCQLVISFKFDPLKDESISEKLTKNSYVLDESLIKTHQTNNNQQLIALIGNGKQLISIGCSFRLALDSNTFKHLDPHIPDDITTIF